MHSLPSPAMEENTGSPRRIRWPDGYNRLTTLETEDPSAHSTDPEFRQICFDLHQQLETVCHTIDWDRIFMTSLATISLLLILFAFFPYLQTQLIADQRFNHQFSLQSLTISEFQTSPDLVTGKCDVAFNVTNLSDRSIYHEPSVLSVFLDHELLWVTRTGDFFIDIRDDVTFTVGINRTAVSVPASFVPTALVESRQLHKPLRFKLKYDGMLREGLAAWYEERSHVYVVCGWVEMRFVDETTLQGGPANCSIDN